MMPQIYKRKNMKTALQFWNATKTRRRMNMGASPLECQKIKCPACDEEYTDNVIMFRRKFRWTIEAKTPKGNLESVFVKVSARPIIEETESNYLNDKMWIPGKIEWEKISITIVDGHPTKWEPLISIMSGENGKTPEQLGNFKLCLYDVCGRLIETWEINEAYVSGIRFVEFFHSASECVDVEFDVTYQKDKVKYINNNYIANYLSSIPAFALKTTCPNCKHEFYKNNIIF
jgi:hypothetical protein